MKLVPPPHLQALLDAYVEVTGLAVTLSYQRAQTLRELDRRGITPADVRAVLQRLKGYVERGVKGYTDASLDWRNAMQEDTLEERALKLRQERARKAGAARVQAASTPRAATVQTGDGNVTRLASPGDAVPEVDPAAVKRALEDFRKNMGRPG
jgi:hypothetical protein